jgi:hypothetical protein
VNRQRRHRAAAIRAMADLAQRPNVARTDLLADRYHHLACELMRDAERHPEHADRIKGIAVAIADLALDIDTD